VTTGRTGRAERHAARGRSIRAALPALLAAVLLSVGLLAAGLLSPPAARALTPEQLDARVQAITDMLRCPTCQGISVRDSEASFSRQIREKVRRMVEEGQSDEDIKAYFVSRYGEWILRAPKKEGLGLVVWLAPGALLVLGGALIGWRVYVGRRAPGRGRPAAELTPEQRERIARDLQRFEEEE
jgi:cytochrome c-type biogenesis protein CcmH